LEINLLFDTLAPSFFNHVKLDTRNLELEGIGQVNITRRRGTKRISMRIKPDGTVQVNHPWFAGQKEVLAFVIQHTGWIREHQKKLAEKRFYYTINSTVETKNHSIQILSIGKGKLQAALKGNQVVLTVPADLETGSDQVQHFIKKVVTEVCRKEAKEYLPLRVQELAIQFGFIYQKVFIKNLKSKWGSCSSTGNINLNLLLMLLPNYLIDYIILHELAHTLEHNHADGFWKLLNILTEGKARQLDKEIRKNHKII
jgi:predicted metal-dependent hydrolase